MRITESHMRSRIPKWEYNGKSPDDTKLSVCLVGSDTELRELLKKIHAECAK